ncbi:MAG: putative cysteine desulfurase, partial [Chloroflexi bacterium]|nr:putative cysteine desulfurase [Chloroflexota bacterium]
LGTTRDDVDYVADALLEIAENGPRWQYGQSPDTGEYLPIPETRVWPAPF